MIKTDTINRYSQVHINDKTIYCYMHFNVRFMLKTIIEHYVKHGSTDKISALDISKAFETVDRYSFINTHKAAENTLYTQYTHNKKVHKNTTQKHKT